MRRDGTATVALKALPERTTEPRWPAIVVLFLAVLMVTSLPAHYQAAPNWFPWTAFAFVVTPMVVIGLKPTSVLWHRIERAVVLAFVALAFVLILTSLLRLVSDMITHRHDFGSITLLESAAVVWTINILIFALFYWQLDRAGPEARAAGRLGSPDFIFGEKEVEELAHGWEPHFIDYLFLAFATSTSLTPPDYSKPSSRRAKLLVMAQASISIVTLVLVASRAVATLS
jgi:hypothetical protein